MADGTPSWVARLREHLRDLLADGPGTLDPEVLAAESDPEVRALLSDARALGERLRADREGTAGRPATEADSVRSLVSSQSFVRRIVDNDPNLVFVKDIEGRFLMVNEAVAEFYGRPKHEFVHLANQAVRPEQREVDAYTSVDQRVIRDQVTITVEESFTHPDGKVTWFRTTKTPVRADDGQMCVLGIAVDITEHKREQMLGARFSAMLESSVDAICSISPQGAIEFWNRSAERMLGYPSEQIVGRALVDLLGAEGHAYLGEMLVGPRHQAVERPPREVRIRHRAGHRLEVLMSVSPVLLPDGARLGAMVLMRDITEDKRLQKELVQARDQAEAAAVTRSRFLANISHEMRTPLNGIIGVNSLLATSELSDEQREYARTIQLSGDMLLSLINDVLDFSKLEYQPFTLELRPFSVAALVREVVSWYRPQANERSLGLSYRLDPRVPERVVGDRARVSQILANLVSNGIKFTERGRVEIEVTVAAPGEDSLTRHERKPSTLLRFRVSDTGIGMAPERRTYLFQPFSQLDDSPTRRYGGTGLGLAICKRLIELMRGTIWVESEEGQGTRVYFTVPAELAETARLPEAHGRAASEVALPPLSILLVEDNRINQKVMVRVLERLGQRAMVAENGARALEELRAADYDLVFMDLHMPEMDGLTATRHILTDWPRERRPLIIAVTADAMHSDRERCLAAGMNDYLSKPVTLDAVRTMMRRWFVAKAEGRRDDTLG